MRNWLLSLKTRLRKAEDLDHTGMLAGGRQVVVKLALEMKTANALGSLINALVTETRDYRNGDCADMLREILDQAVAAQISPYGELNVYVKVGRETLATFDAWRKH